MNEGKSQNRRLLWCNSFGDSYDPSYQPSGISYYVEVFVELMKQQSVSDFHVIGHHTGASIATEMAVLYPDQVLSITLVGPALLNSEEQKLAAKEELVVFNRPVIDGSHLLKNWNYAATQGGWDADMLHGQVLDCLRAWEGRIQAYTCVFSQPMIELLGKVTCPVLTVNDPKDMLYSYVSRVKEAVSWPPSLPNQLILIYSSNQILWPSWWEEVILRC